MRLAPKPCADKKSATAGGVLPSRHSTISRASGWRWRPRDSTRRSGRVSVEGEGDDLGAGPRQRGAGESEGVGRRDHGQFVRRDMAREDSTDAIVHGVAGGENADRFRPPCEERGEARLRRARPFEARASVVRDHRQMAAAARQGFGRVDQTARAPPEARQPVLADADDRKPRCHGAVSPSCIAEP